VRRMRIISGFGLIEDDPDLERIDNAAVTSVDFSKAEISGAEDFHPEIVPGRVRPQDDIADDLKAVTAAEVPYLISVPLIQLHEQHVTTGNMDSFAVEAVVDSPDPGLSTVVRESGDAGNEICGRRRFSRKGKCACGRAGQ
jgi:hypothetical protein